MLAASNNHAETVHLLAKQGANIDAIEKTLGWTALIWAAKNGYRETVSALLEYNADTSIQDANGNNASEWALKNEHQDVVNLFSDDR